MLRRLVQICDYFFLCTSKLSQTRSELELSVLFIIIWNLRMIYWRWDLIATYSRAFHRNASSVPWGITHIKRGHGTPEDEGEGWGTEDAGITVWEGRADHSLFLSRGQEFFMIIQRTTLSWPSLIDCTDTWINCAWKNLCVGLFAGGVTLTLNLCHWMSSDSRGENKLRAFR